MQQILEKDSESSVMVIHKKTCQEMAQLFKRFEKGGDLAFIEDRDESDNLLESRPSEERELRKEPECFADLWRYLQERKENLGPEIVSALRQENQLERTAWLKEIDQKLMERVGDAGQGAQFRH